MNRPEPTPATVQRVRTLSLVVLGAMIPLLLSTALDLLTVRPSHGAASWRDYASSIGMLVVGIATMIVAFRVARYSKLPGVPTILLLMGLVVSTVLVSHFF